MALNIKSLNTMLIIMSPPKLYEIRYNEYIQLKIAEEQERS